MVSYVATNTHATRKKHGNMEISYDVKPNGRENKDLL